MHDIWGAQRYPEDPRALRADPSLQALNPNPQALIPLFPFRDGFKVEAFWFRVPKTRVSS